MAKISAIDFLSRLPFYGALHSLVQEVKYRQWKKAGCPVPPPHKVKQQTLKKIAAEHGLDILVETGTLLGDMIHALRNRFSKIYSIELYEPLYRRAVKRFRRQGHINLLNGDSGVVLYDLVPELDASTLFWLDGHYSGDGTAQGDQVTPVFKELDAIFSIKQPYVVAIDDARLFNTDPGYPTMDELMDFLRSRDPQLHMQIENDIITISKKDEAVT